MPSFLEIYDSHKHVVYNLCLHYLQNTQDAEEAAQDVFIKIHEKLSSFRGEASLTTWVYRIAVNQCLDALKARKRQKRWAFFKDIFSGQTDTPLDFPDFNHPGVQLEDREALERVFQKINELPENQKTAILLKYLDDLSQREMAAIMEISEKAVESLLQRAKQNLDKKLKTSEGL